MSSPARPAASQVAGLDCIYEMSDETPTAAPLSPAVVPFPAPRNADPPASEFLDRPGRYPVSPDLYLRDELTRVAHLVRAYVLGRPASTGPADARLAVERGFQWDTPVAGPDASPDRAAAVAEADGLEQHIVRRLRLTRDDVRSRLPAWELARRFGLVANLGQVFQVADSDAGDSAVRPAEPADLRRDSLALDVLLLALLCDRFPQYRAALAAPAGGGLTAETALHVLQPTAAPPDLRWSVFAPTAPLIANDLVTLSAADAPADRAVRIDPRVGDFLLGGDPPPDPALGDAVTVDRRWRTWDMVRLDAGVVAQLRRLSEWWWSERDKVHLLVLLHGPWGTPFASVVQALLTRVADGRVMKSRPVVTVDTPAGLRAGDWAEFVRRVYREAVFRRAVVLWTRAEAVLSAGPADGRADVLVRRAEQTGVTTVLASEVGWDQAEAFRSKHRYFVRVELPVPAPQVRRGIWKHRLVRERNPLAADASPGQRATLDTLETFQFTEGQVADTIATARGLALLAAPAADGARPGPTPELLYEACRRQAARWPVAFAQRVPPRPAPADLKADPRDVLRSRVVLPPATGTQLGELFDRMVQQDRVYHGLGLERRLSLGTGLIALFAGPSGTGKTLAALTLAGLLRKDLYKVDTSSVVSKFVGETEKNLARVFADAQTSNAVLFFDEADGLLGKRGEIAQTQDRWANSGVNELMQRIDEYRGTVILTTNFRQNIDPAFYNRVQVMIEFPKPDAAARLNILEGMFAGTSAAVADEAGNHAEGRDAVRAVLKPIADRFDLTGGNLRNAVLDAVFRAAAGAAEQLVVVTPRELVLGVAREFQKNGNPPTVTIFGRDWFALVEKELGLGRGA